jgi:hypothetical protein
MTNNDAAKILTTTTRRFRGNVLAKQDKSGTRPVTYANLSQAERKRNELRAAGVECHVTASWPFMVVID